MGLHEPMTLVTDYALGLLSAVLAVRMRHRGLAQSRSQWSAALCACAVAAFAGGTYHGFLPWMDERVAAVLWRLTLLAIGFAAYAASVATARAQLPGQLQGLVTWAARVKLAIYAIAAISSGAFSVAIVDYSLSFGFVLAAHCWTWARTRDKAAPDGHLRSGGEFPSRRDSGSGDRAARVLQSQRPVPRGADAGNVAALPGGSTLGSAGPVAYSTQPCASWTLTMTARISFQVWGSSITSLGNMQPSQQMWRHFRVSSPFLSRSQ